MNDRRDTTRREDRRQAILDAAESLFLEQGFERVSVNAIVQRSGGSLATVYDLFGNKHGLLYAVVDRARNEGLKGVEDIYAAETRPGAVLRELALRYYAFATTPRSLALMRLVIAQSLSDPEFGRRFNQDVHLRFVARLAEAFRRWTAAGKARIDRPQDAADLYFAIVLCDAPVRALLGIAPDDTNADALNWRLAPFLEHYHIAA
ncbi:TetR/AcrR family transcriptional regulator [Hephaestia sp. GCM10023244]|uniref:TetR/AcrR family transcriptional regulator n=1 Tax=unclassified Hephaestia TaxID=2631281 RepID=UPI0020777BF7|nr:TetR/AcrR family transcriptional regulator [Hephaestia sp. MAHUQ-44]MCM8730084.1 TetR/AcrR family transcriptional regulator [Hephaestia sp. MAHUQ-44]